MASGKLLRRVRQVRRKVSLSPQDLLPWQRRGGSCARGGPSPWQALTHLCSPQASAGDPLRAGVAPVPPPSSQPSGGERGGGAYEKGEARRKPA